MSYSEESIKQWSERDVGLWLSEVRSAGKGGGVGRGFDCECSKVDGCYVSWTQHNPDTASLLKNVISDKSYTH